jgi:hypothetical protein
MLGLAMLFLDNRFRLAILFISPLVHTTAFIFSLGVFLLLLIEEKTISFKGFAFPFCSPFWGSNSQMQNILEQNIIEQQHTSSAFTINTLLSLLFKRLPIFFLVPSALQLLREKKVTLFALLAGFIFAGIFIHSRFLYFAALPMVCGLGLYWKQANKKMKIVLGLLCVAYFVFNLWQFYSLVNNC